MTRKIYIRRRSENRTGEHKGLFWIIAAMMLILLMIPILWTQYPFRSHKQDRQSENGRVLTTGKIPRLQGIVKQVPRAIEESGEEAQEAPTKEAISIKPLETQPEVGGKIPQQYQGQPSAQVNPYEMAARAEQQREAREEEAKKAVSEEGLKDMGVLAKIQSPELSNTQSGDTHDLYQMLKERESGYRASGEKSANARPEPKATSSSSENETSPKSDKKPVISNPDYFIQVGAFSQEANASALKSRLQKMGYPVVIHKVHHTRLGQLYLVRIPFEGSYAEVQKEEQKLEKIVGDKPIIVRPR
ncbi:SPOR domain-containing protein [Thermodesulforhabdus norvegica]|uniref:Sporulation related domain-containing protein n=1 Tax=Thermodesulforhabdus norvegica TaxID=39841 RepID=A0A1I4URG3_9BACT|nr:SPOR domain-containing protein [Thermodesulforhabdus norvegica]SFM91562.1 Sporulation related domain-containing protein [Thermodesulforhabdus norvegica]